jgi:hypothetical protein
MEYNDAEWANPHLPTLPYSESSDDGEENCGKILLHQPSFSINNNNEGASACRIVSMQLKHLLQHGNCHPQNDSPLSTINRFLKQVKGRTGEWYECLTSTATVWLLRLLYCSHGCNKVVTTRASHLCGMVTWVTTLITYNSYSGQTHVERSFNQLLLYIVHNLCSYLDTHRVTSNLCCSYCAGELIILQYLVISLFLRNSSFC